jgi:hypothetical protein
MASGMLNELAGAVRHQHARTWHPLLDLEYKKMKSVSLATSSHDLEVNNVAVVSSQFKLRMRMRTMKQSRVTGNFPPPY